ncbi:MULTISPECIES: hypothetical protein [Vibrio]|uniref:hypothetical protein n=1 Tax=Vibrio TaxID=662 RepID=UPI0004DEEE5D|nr:hypothetical protein [Vibrio parahaemolyticus]EGQ9239472.1 hypothetical protein [Vibrio vulnificus]EHD1698114.1 hypothetical protein [Vibrio vulnificus]EKZ9225843.1 hypothetical protein [Vibrio vulnificus]ELC9582685.1 hypothetical protein [Vibrio vulnificus]MCU8149778.1 hypothetical protein [Vibrio vulnificus]
MLGLPTFTQITNLISDALSDTAFSHCNLVCVSSYDPEVLINVDGSVFSVIEVLGTHRYLTSETEVSFINELDSSVRDTLREANHTIGMMYVRDPSRTAGQLDHCFQPTIDTIERLGIDAVHFFEEQKKDLQKHCAFERTLLIIKTARQAIQASPLEEKTFAGEKVVIEEVPAIAQNTLLDSEQLIQQHNAYVKILLQAFSQYLVMERLTGEVYLRHCSEEETLTSMQGIPWRTKSIADEVDLTLNDNENSFVTHPPLAYQIITDDKSIVPKSRGIIDCGTHYIATIDREYFHIKPEYSTFNEFFRSVDKNVPFRMYYELVTGTDKMITELNVRRTWLLWVAFTQYSRNTDTACKSLIQEADQNNATLLKGTLSIATWSTELSEVQQHKKDLLQALRSWGTLTPRTPPNLFAGYYSTLPAFSKKQTSRPCIQKSNKHIATLPITRASTPVKQGAICMSSLDGKLIPIEPYTSLQDYSANAITGGMNAGKTVFSSVYCNAIMFGRGNIDLPPLAYTDFGSGVHNYLNSLKAWLPANQLYKVVCISLVNKVGNAVNILEPQYGLNSLVDAETGFATSFLTRIINGTSDKPVNGQLASAIYKIIQYFFTFFKENPITYSTHLGEYVEEEERLHKEINKLIEQRLIIVEEHELFSWYTVRDKLFRLDKDRYFNHARFCHRQGSPDLTDLMVVLRMSDKLRESLESYRVEQASDVYLIDHIITSLDSITTRFRHVLGKKSQLDVSQARVVGVDLRGIAGGSSQDADTLFVKQVFGMLGNRLATRNFWREPKEFMKLVPEMYKEHYSEILEAESYLCKHSFIDEYKQMKSPEMDANQSQQVLIARKYQLICTIASQQLDHLPRDFLKLASNLYCLTVSEDDCNYLQSAYSLSDEFISEIKRKVRTDTEFGRIILYIAKFTKYHGHLVHLLRNHITPTYLWNFSSDKDDETIKSMARKRFGEKSAFLRLAKAFPNGSAKGSIEKRLDFTGIDSQKLTKKDVINELVNSLSHIDI